jgi:hypothetical protein
MNAKLLSPTPGETGKARARLGVTLDTMWSVKDYILSGALAQIATRFEVVAWVAPELLDGTKRLATEVGIRDVTFRSLRGFHPSRIFSAVCRVQKSILLERHDVATERVMRLRRESVSVRARGRLHGAAGLCLRMVAKSPIAGAVLKSLEAMRRWTHPAGVYTADFAEFGFHALFFTDPIRREVDSLYFEALRRGIPAATLVLSWDNLTAKGQIHADYSRIMVWNEVMRAELKALYPGIAESRIDIVGFPRFDVYRRPLPAEFARSPFLEQLGLDPSKRVMLFANSATKTFRTQPAVIRHICEAMQRGELPDDVQLLIRCHPHDDVEEYSVFRGWPRVAVWPDAERAKTQTLFEQTPASGELLTLAASVQHSAVCINPGSTVMLDAALADVPIVCVAYDGDEQLPYWESYRTCYDYSHQAQFHRVGATDICYSRTELIASICDALSNRRRKQAQRMAVVDRYLGGKAESLPRIIKCLESMCRDVGAQRTSVVA